MADNYLEKRYAEVFGGGAKAAGKGRPGLDVLLKKAGGSGLEPLWHASDGADALVEESDASSGILPRQLDCLVRAAREGCGDLPAVPIIDASGARIELPLLQGTETLLLAGMALQSMRLKAAEMGFCTQLSLRSPESASSPVTAVLLVFRRG